MCEEALERERESESVEFHGLWKHQNEKGKNTRYSYTTRWRWDVRLSSRFEVLHTRRDVMVPRKDVLRSRGFGLLYTREYPLVKLADFRSRHLSLHIFFIFFGKILSSDMLRIHMHTFSLE